MTGAVRGRWLWSAAGLLTLAIAFILLRSWTGDKGVRYHGKTVAEWSTLVFGQQAQADEASAALKQMGPAAVPDLVKLLSARDSFLQPQIRSVVRGWPAPFGKWLAPYTTRLPAAWVKRAAARSLGIIGPPAREAVPALLVSLRNPDEGFAWEAAGALGRIGEPALPGLLEAMRAPMASTRRAAAYALGGIRSRPDEVVPVLIAGLQDPDAALVSTAFASLGRLGLPAVAQLLTTVAQEQGPIRERAGRLVLQCYDDWPGLKTNTESGDVTSGGRQQAIAKLGRVGLPDDLTLQIWTGALRDPAPAVRIAAMNYLSSVAPIPLASLAGLARCLNDGSPEVREAAATALGKQATAAAPVVPALKRLLEDTNETVRIAARSALGKIQPE